MATGQTPAPDQLPDPTKIKQPIQLLALVVVAVVGLIATYLKLRSWTLDLASIATVSFSLFLGYLFTSLKSFPEKDRAPVVLKAFYGLIRGLCIFWVIVALVQIAPLLFSLSRGSSSASVAETALTELSKDLNGLRADYRMLPWSVNQAPELNAHADQLAHKIQDISDTDLKLGSQIFKYESLAYAYGIIAGSEMIAGDRFSADDKAKAIAALLENGERAQKLIEEARRGQLADDKLQKLRAWLRDDDADARLQRLTAVGLCFRWQVSHNNTQDRDEARELVKTLPAYYKAKEHPERSYELSQCVKDTEPEAPSSKATVPLKRDDR